MISITQRNLQVRIWLNELPGWSYKEIQVLEHRQEALNLKLIGIRESAVEMLLHTGGKMHYGALGAGFVPDQSKELVIQVPISTEDGPLFENALERYDIVHVGLPQEYTGFLDSVVNTPGTELLGVGILRFCRAAHGSIGSSPWIFGILSNIIVKLLLLDQPSPSEEHLLELIELELRLR